MTKFNETTNCKNCWKEIIIKKYQWHIREYCIKCKNKMDHVRQKEKRQEKRLLFQNQLSWE